MTSLTNATDAPLGLYLHVPFCSAICAYCNFNRGLYEESLKTRYVTAVIREIERCGARENADTIYFGGGTPSLLTPIEVGRMIDACRRVFQMSDVSEVTLEINPEDAIPARLDGYREVGVNRLSFGVQSF
jgi:oxygen-independent coproporphyrinogen-3 oxidase